MRVYCHGNCQASALGWLLAEIKPNWTIKSREVHNFDILQPTQFEQYCDDIRSADIILSQPVSDNYRGVDFLSLSWLKAHKRPDGQLCVFPSIHYRGYNPQIFGLGIEAYKIGYDDVHIADMYASGLSVEECHDRITSPMFFTRAFVLSEAMTNLRELIRREDVTGSHARVSPILATRMDQELLFHTFNHPNRRILVSVVEQLMAAAGQPVTLPLVGMCYLNNTRIIPYPSAVTSLGMDVSAVPERGLFVHLHVAMPLVDFVKKAYEAYEQAGREQLRTAISNNKWASAYLERYRNSQPLEQGFNAGSFVEGLFRTLLRRHPTAPDVAYWVKRLSEIGPAEVVRHITLSDEFQDRENRVVLELI
ncbi:WcbI family polysaccharide biosynthesis putative acetyltransferase [Methylobacterium nigriterrae]|uniref:WcbI family polysaccharide biosynthesis putative acetyltransferase n=1 Tax=Methylobacterium nigriterrae TaxID=3127512 RepID=UPI003013490B